MSNVAYTVSQINNYIKDSFDNDPLLKRLSIKGEVSNLKYHSSGHIYFTLKDEKAAISAVMFAGNRQGLRYRMENGDKVIVTGSISVYERDGKYQIYAREIVSDGQGDLFIKFQQLKERLEKEGLFRQELKRPLPLIPKTVGIVTSETGAAIQDIINVASRRNPCIQLILYPAKVQGEDAYKTVCRGIEALNKTDAEVIIIGRGGGSIEDLWAFNEEAVARAIRNSRVPVISAVGHETDYSIADFAADLRAPTPSAAAELAIPDLRGIDHALNEYREQLVYGLSDIISRYRRDQEFYRLSLERLSPENVIKDGRIKAINLESSLANLMDRIIEAKKHSLYLYIERMKGLSPLNKLSGGYAYVTDPKGKAVKDPMMLKEKDVIGLRFKKGKIKAEVLEIEE